MSGVKCFNGGQARKCSVGDGEDEDLLTIHLVVDHRVKDEARP